MAGPALIYTAGFRLLQCYPRLKKQVTECHVPFPTGLPKGLAAVGYPFRGSQGKYKGGE